MSVEVPPFFRRPGGPPSADASLWSATAPTLALAEGDLPDSIDLAIIGGGYTGLAAARAAARAGASVVVLEREQFGFGASGRNGGFVLPGYKADLTAIVHRFGLPRARTLFQASLDAIAFVEQLVRDESIECHWHRPGAIVLAARPGHMPGLNAEQRLLAREFSHGTHLLGRADLRDEIGSNRYHGGLLDPTAGALHPMEYLVGLGQAAVRAGAMLRSGVGVESIGREAGGFLLRTSRGPVRARETLVATNGHTGPLVSWLQRRIVPVGSFLIATVPLDPALALRLIPRGRVLSDSKQLLYYFRLSPDRRLLFGGRAAFRAERVEQSLALLQAGMIEVFPELAGTPVEFGWGGTLGFTRDHLPHAGRHDDIGYAVGYGGHGVALATALGHQTGEALAGRGPWPAIAEAPFPAIPLYNGRPWFLPLAGAYYGLKDRLI